MFASLNNLEYKYSKEAVDSGDKKGKAVAGKGRELLGGDGSEEKLHGGCYLAERPEQKNAESGKLEGAFLPS